MLEPFRWLTQTLGSPKDQKSDQMAIAVLFTTFLSFVVTMSVVVMVIRPPVPPQVGPVSTPPLLCPSGYLAERVPESDPTPSDHPSPQS